MKFVLQLKHARLDQARLQPFVVAVGHVPQREGGKETLLLQRFQRSCVHAAGGDQYQPADLVRVLLGVDLRHHAAVTGTNENGAGDTQFSKKRRACAPPAPGWCAAPAGSQTTSHTPPLRWANRELVQANCIAPIIRHLPRRFNNKITQKGHRTGKNPRAAARLL